MKSPTHSNSCLPSKINKHVGKPYKSKDHENNRFSPKTIFLVGNFNHPKLWTIILIALDFQGKYSSPMDPSWDDFQNLEKGMTRKSEDNPGAEGLWGKDRMGSSYAPWDWNTVDGRNLARKPPVIYETWWIMGYLPYPLVIAGFLNHHQYLPSYMNGGLKCGWFSCR